jgi:hypothetical protein
VVGWAIPLLLALMVPAPAPASQEAGPPSHPTLRAIEEAAATGEISTAEAVLYKVYAIKQAARLPARFQSAESFPIRCATQIVEEARHSVASLPGPIRIEVEGALVRPALPSFLDTAHFRIHYATGGADMIHGWPDTAYRDAVAAACEKSWSFYHETEAWPVPPPDGASGGSGLIDCYVTDSGTGIYGYTQSEDPVAGGYPDDWTAFLVIDNDYAGFGYEDRTLPMRVTVAHEYHHVVQMGMKATGAPWFMENTSTWQEDQVYDEINDNHAYLNCYFGSPQERLNKFNGCWEYACFLWPTYLQENWGHSVVRDIWQDFASGQNLYAAIDGQLAPYGKSLDSGMAEWARWNVFTRDRNDGKHYQEVGAYEAQVAFDGDYSSYPQLGRHPSPGRMPEGLGANFTRFRPQTGSTDNKIEITYVGPGCSVDHEISFVRKFRDEAMWEEFVVAVDGTGRAAFTMLRWDETEYLFLVVPMKRSCGSTGKDFAFNAIASRQSADVADGVLPTRVLRLDQNHPNPFYPSTTIEYTLPAACPVDLSIYDAAGRRIRTLVTGPQTAGEHRLRWLGTDDAGRMVPVGVYFYTLRAGGETAVRKMLLLE